jgi:predicted alpha/beta hydrolase
MAGYRHADWRGLDIDPATSGLGAIGHMGYFRPQAEPLWRGVLDWFESLPAAGDRHAHA